MSLWYATQMTGRSIAAPLDAYIAAVENGPNGGQLRWLPENPQVMYAEQEWLIGVGLLAPGEPTPYSHWVSQQELQREFTPQERVQIRVFLGLLEEDQ